MIDFPHWHTRIKITIPTLFTIMAITLSGLFSGVLEAEDSNESSRLERYIKGETLPDLIPEELTKRTTTKSRRSQIPGNIEFHYVRLSSALSALIEKDEITKTDIQQLLPIYEDFKGNHLLLLNRLREDQDRLDRLGLNNEIVFRQSKELSRYLDLSEGLIASLDGLSNWAKKEDTDNLFIGLWQKLVKFYYELRLSFNVDDVIEQVKKGKERTILHASNDLPYRSLALKNRVPKTEPEVIPSYLQDSLLEPNVDTLKSYLHAPLSELITKQAAKLDYDAIKIYEFVHNEIDTQWYAGAMKGAENTLKQKSGNDVDQASLLIALFRASSIPAQYVSGVVEIPVNHFQQQTGIQNPTDIASFINKAGYASKAVIQGGKVAKLTIEYTWVSALVPYANYRGTQIDGRGKSWVPLAPAFKQYSGESSKDLMSSYAFNQSQLRSEYLTTQKESNPLSEVRSFLEKALVEDKKDAQLSLYKNRQKITKENLDYLPNSLPMSVLVVTSENPKLAESQQQWVHFQIKGQNDQKIILDTNVPLASLDSRRVTLSYLPETIDDQNLINAFGGMTNVPSYLVSLRPQIKLEGKVLAAGSGGVPMGDYHNLSISVQSPAGTEYFTRTLLSGSYHALGFVSQKHNVPYDSSVQSAGDSEHLGARLLAQIALRYSKNWMQNEQALAELNGLTLVRPMPALTIASNSYKKESILNVVYSLEWQSVTLDAIFKPVDTIVNDEKHNLLITKQQKQKEWMQTSALEGSYLEHKIFENDFGVKSISADQGLKIAYETGNPVHQINSASQSIIATLNQNDNVKENIHYWVSQNYEVMAPQNPISQSDWAGAVWKVLNPNTGESGYLISGSLAGGETADASWANKDLQNALIYLWNGTTHPDTTLGAINIIGDSWVKGRPEEEVALKVLVTSVSGIPMSEFVVEFELVDGGGTLQCNAPNFICITDDTGIVTINYTFGTSTREGNQVFTYDTYDGVPPKNQGNEDEAAQKTSLSHGNIWVTQVGKTYSVPGGVTFQLFPGEISSLKTVVHFGEAGQFFVKHFLNHGGDITVEVLDEFGNPIANAEIEVTHTPGFETQDYIYLDTLQSPHKEFQYRKGFNLNGYDENLNPIEINDNFEYYINRRWGSEFWKVGGIFLPSECNEPSYNVHKCAEQYLKTNNPDETVTLLRARSDNFGVVSFGLIYAGSGFESTISFKEIDEEKNSSELFEKESKLWVLDFIELVDRNFAKGPDPLKYARPDKKYHNFISFSPKWASKSYYYDGKVRGNAVLPKEVASQNTRLYLEVPLPAYSDEGVAWEAPIVDTIVSQALQCNGSATIENNVFLNSSNLVPMVDSWVPLIPGEIPVKSDLAEIKVLNAKPGFVDFEIKAGDDLGHIEIDYALLKYSFQPQFGRTIQEESEYNTFCDTTYLKKEKPPVKVNSLFSLDNLYLFKLATGIWVVQPTVESVVSDQLDERKAIIEGVKVNQFGQSVGNSTFTLKLEPLEFIPGLTFVEVREYENEAEFTNKNKKGVLISKNFIPYDQRGYKLTAGLNFDINKVYSLTYLINDEKVYSEKFKIPLYQDIFISPNGQNFKKKTRIDAANNWVCEAGNNEITFNISHKSEISLKVRTDSGIENLVHGAANYEKGIYTLDTGIHEQGTYILEAISSIDEHVEIREGKFGIETTVIDSVPIGHTIVEGVDIFDGSLSLSRDDLSIGGRGPGLNFRRSYSSNSDHVGVLGKGWSHNYSMQLVSQGCGMYRITGGLGSALFFSETSTTQDSSGKIIDVIESFRPGKGYHGSLVKGEEADTWDYFSKDGTRYHFKQFSFDSPNSSWHIEYVEDQWGNKVEITYITQDVTGSLQDPFFWDNTLVSKVTDSSGRSLIFDYEVIEEEENTHWIGASQPKNYRHNRLVNVKGLGNINEEDPENFNADFQYDKEGSLISANVRGALETYEYKRHPYVEGEYLTLEENLEEGLLTKVQNPLEFETSYSYEINEMGYTIDYAQQGVKKAFVISINRSIGNMSFTWGQRTNRIVDLTTGINNFRGINVDYVMDSYGLSLTQSIPEKSFTWNTDHYVVESETIANGFGSSDLTMEYEYDEFANITKQSVGGFETSFTYFKPKEGEYIKNLMESRTDGKSNTTSYTYTKNRVSTIEYPDGSNESYVYSDNGDIKSKIDKLGKTVSYKSDAFGYIIEENYSDCCNKNYSFNALGEMLTEVNGREQTIIYTYNERGHLISKDIGIGSPENYTVDILGNRLTETDFRSYEKTWSNYNELNQPQSITWDIGTQIISKSLSYDAHGNKLTESDWRGTLTTYGYNDNDHLVSESSDGEPAINISYDRDASGFVTLDDQGSGRTRAYTYNALHNILTDTDGEGGQVVSEYDDNGNQISRTDRNGNETTFSYDAMNRVTLKTLPDGLGSYSYGYDGNGNPTSEARPDGTSITRTFSQANQLLSEKVNGKAVQTNEYDSAGSLAFSINGISETTSYSGYDILGRPSEMSLPSPLNAVNYIYSDSALHTVSEANGNNTVVSTYDGQNNLILVNDNIGLVSEFTRDPNGNVLSSKDANGNETTRNYNSLNQVATEESPSGLVTSNTWDEFNNLLTSNVGPLTLSYTYDNRNARLTEADNVGTTTWGYDAEGNVTSIKDKNNNITTTTYDALNNPATITEPIGQVRTIKYNGLGQLIQDMDRKGIVTTYKYDAFGNQIETTRDNLKVLTQVFDTESNLKTSIDAKGNTTTYEYFPQGILRVIKAPELAVTTYDIDFVGNRIKTTDNIPRTTTWTYDARNRALTEKLPGNRESTFTYDGNGNMLSKTLPEGGSWTYSYNSLNQILTINGPENTGLSYSYDDRGNKTNYTDAKGQSTVYTYDALSRLESMDAPVLAAHLFTYDFNGNLASETDPADNVITYAYDGLNREITKTISPAAGFVNSVTQVSTSYDPNGNVLSVNETGPNAGTASFVYDNFNRMTSKTDQNNKTINYGYDLNGNRTSLFSQLPSGVKTHQTVYSYDDLNRVSTVIADGQPTTYTYFNDSQLKKIAYPSGISANYLYNAAGFLQSISNVQGGSAISSVDYLYDLNGNRTQQIQNNGFGNVTTTYEYDGADRLTKESRDDGQ